MRKLLTLTAAAALAVALGFSGTASAAPTFFLSPGTAATGDLPWQAGVGPFTEFNLEGFACGSIQQNLTDGSTTITIGPGATGQEIFCSPSAFAAAGGVFGTVEDRSLLNRDSTGTPTVNLTFAFSQPVAGFGLWIFDDGAATPDSFTMTVTESGGAMTTSAVLDAAIGATGHQVEGFIGATSSVGITSVTINHTGGSPFFEVDHLQLGGPVPGLSKEVTSGPDVDGDSEIDVVIEVGQGTTTAYDFTITYVPGEEAGALVVDTVPAEWDVIEIEGDGSNLPLACGGSTSFDVNALSGDDVDVFRGGKSGKNCRSANNIEWTPDPNEDVSTLLVDITTRINPGHGKRSIEFYSPTSCGPLFLNDGAEAFELDENGDLILPPVSIAGPTDPICLVAVDDPDGTSTGPGADRSATADHDGDGLASFDEACVNEIRTNPCDPDTDGDGFPDNVDQCPLIFSTVNNGCPE